MTTYTIKQTTGAHIREAMRSADGAEEAAETLLAIGRYTGIGDTVEAQDGGDIVLLDGDRVVDVGEAPTPSADSPGVVRRQPRPSASTAPIQVGDLRAGKGP